MKNILLLGDSIRMGYDKAVREALEGKANVYFPEDNCRFAAYLFRYLHEYAAKVPERKVDILHWNAGLWDCVHIFEEGMQTPIDVYAYYIERICVRIKKLFPNAVVIFATTTRVIPEKMRKDFMRLNEDIEALNDAAVEIVKKHGFLVDDLYAVSARLPEEAHSDGTHYYTPAGTEAFSKQVLSCLLPYLEDK